MNHCKCSVDALQNTLQWGHFHKGRGHLIEMSLSQKSHSLPQVCLETNPTTTVFSLMNLLGIQSTGKLLLQVDVPHAPASHALKASENYLFLSMLFSGHCMTPVKTSRTMKMR